MREPTNRVAIDLDEDGGDAVASAGQPQLSAGVVDEDAPVGGGLPLRAVRNEDGTVTLPLLFPQTLQVKKGGKVREERIESLTFHRLNGADQRAIAAASDASRIPVAFSRSTRIGEPKMNVLFDRMDLADIEDAGLVLESFLPSGRRTGRRG